MHPTYKKAFTLNFDDGNVQDLRFLNLINQYGLKATFNINTGLNYDKGTWEHYSGLIVHRLNMEESIEAYKGHEIAVHGYEHLAWTDLSPEALQQELQRDYDKITELTGAKPIGAAYPYGAYGGGLYPVLEQLGIRYCRTVENTHKFDLPQNPLEFHPSCHQNEPELFDLIDQFLTEESDEPMLFSLWGHSYEFEGEKSWDRIERAFEKIAGREDIFYCTTAEGLGLA